MASSGMLCRAHHPAITAAVVKRNTMKRWRAESSMIWSIISGGSPNPSGNWPEVTMRSPAFKPLKISVRPSSCSPIVHRARLEVAVSAIHEHGLVVTRIQHRRLRNHQPARAAGLEFHLAVHIGLQRVAGFLNLDPHFERARSRVHLGQDVAHPPVERAPGR